MKVRKVFKSFTPTSINEQDHTVRVRMTDASVDRHGEVLTYEGWDFDDFMQNPVVLVNHDDWQLPVGNVIEVIPVPAEKAYDAVVQFDVEDEDAAKVWGKVVRGYLKTVSVGFLTLLQQGNEILQKQLLELSFVTIPANPNATTRGLRDGTIDTEDARWLLDRAQNEVKSLTKFLSTDKLDSNSKGATMDKEQLQTALTEALKPLQDALAKVPELVKAEVEAATAGLTEQFSTLSEKVEKLPKSDTKSPKEGDGTDDEELSDEEAEKLLAEYDDDLAEEYKTDSTDEE